MPARDIGRVTLAVSIVDGLSAPLTRGETMLRFVQRALAAAPGPAPYWRHASGLRPTAAGRPASTLNAAAAVAKRAGGVVASMFERAVAHASAMDAVPHQMAGNLLPLHSAPAASLPVWNKPAEAAVRAMASIHAVSVADVAGLDADDLKTMRRLARISVKRDHLRRAGSNGAAMLFRAPSLTGAGRPFSPDTGAGSIGQSAADKIARASAVVQKALPLIRGVVWREAIGELRNSHSSLDGNAEISLLMLRGLGGGQNGSNMAKALGRRAAVKGTVGKITSTTSSVAPLTTAVAAMRLDHERFGPALRTHVVRPARPPYESSDFPNIMRKRSEFTLGTAPSDGRPMTAVFSKLISAWSAPSQLRGFGEVLRMSSVADAGRARKHLPKGMAKLEGEPRFGMTELGGRERNASLRAAGEWPGAVTGATPTQATTELSAIGQRFHTEGQTSFLSSSRAQSSFGLAHIAASLRPIANALDTLVAIASRLRRGPAFRSIDGNAICGDGVRPPLLRVARQLNLLQGPISTHGSAREAPVRVTVNAPLTVNGDIVEQAGLLTILDTWWRQKEPAVVNAVERARRQAARTAARGSMVDAGDASSRLNGFAMALGSVQ